MEEIEVPTEHLHETIHEKVGEAGWFRYVAISTALMAVFAAFSSLMAGHHSNEALIDQIKASDQWSYFQAKGIKGEIKNYRPITEWRMHLPPVNMHRNRKKSKKCRRSGTQFC